MLNHFFSEVASILQSFSILYIESASKPVFIL